MQYNKVITSNYDWKLKKIKRNKINNVVIATFCIVTFNYASINDNILEHR